MKRRLVLVLVGFLLMVVSAGANTTASDFSATTSTGVSLATANFADCYTNKVQATTGLLNYWRLGEASGTNAADAKGTNAGTYVNGPTLGGAAAYAGMGTNTSVALNGTSQYVNNVDINDFTGTAAFSLETWVKRTAASTSYDRIISKEATSGSNRLGYNLFMRPSSDAAPYSVGFDRFDGTTSSDVVSSTTAMNLNAWNHIVVTYSGTQLRMYVNGTLEGTSSATRTMNNTASPFRIGADQNAASPFHGAFDEVAVYSTALAQATVTDHANGCTPGHVQSTSVQENVNDTDIAATFAGANTAGNLIAAAFSYDASSGSTPTCSDIRGNTYAIAANVLNTTDNQRLAVCYAPNAAAGTNTLTVTFSANTNYKRLLIGEYKGIATSSPVDITRTNFTTGTAATDNVTSTAGTTTSASALIFGASDIQGAATVVAGTGFTERTSIGGTPHTSIEDRTVAATGSYAATFTASATSKRYTAAMVVFKGL